LKFLFDTIYHTTSGLFTTRALSGMSERRGAALDQQTRAVVLCSAITIDNNQTNKLSKQWRSFIFIIFNNNMLEM